MTSARRYPNRILSAVQRRRSTVVGSFLIFLAGMVLIPSARSQTYTETLLYSFAGGSDGSDPYWPLIIDTAGNVYSTTSSGGTEQGGMDFEISPQGKETVLYNFGYGSTEGGPPSSGLVLQNGILYGAASAGGAFGHGVVYEISSPGHEKVLYSFRGGSDGATPYGNLAIDSLGNLYGTTSSGGKSGWGTVFKLAPNGIKTILHNFGGASDGEQPLNGLIRDSNGNLYGTTATGGKSGWGTIFRVSATGTETVLYSFTSFVVPTTVVRDSAGNLYGTTTLGGPQGYGTVYKLNTAGQLTVLHNFQDGDGEGPSAGLIRDTAGNLYGTTYSGGTYSFGTVFKIDATGHESILYSFQAGTDGAQPLAPVIEDSKGNLFGTTKYGGAQGAGAVFELHIQ